MSYPRKFAWMTEKQPSALMEISGSLCELELTQKDCFETMVEPIYKTGDNSSFENPRAISLFVVSRSRCIFVSDGKQVG